MYFKKKKKKILTIKITAKNEIVVFVNLKWPQKKVFSGIFIGNTTKNKIKKNKNTSI